jgi:hypothetical protein
VAQVAIVLPKLDALMDRCTTETIQKGLASDQ